MIQLISREEVFYLSSVADHFISACQQYLAKDSWENLSDFFCQYIDGIAELGLPAKDPFDHLEPFHNDKEILDKHCYIELVEDNDAGYSLHRTNAFIRFFELLDVRQLYLVDEMKFNWLQYPFKEKEHHEWLRSLVNKAFYDEAFRLDIKDLTQVLPAFYRSARHSVSLMNLFSVANNLIFSSFLCDDQHLHLDFPAKEHKRITAAAVTSGLKITDMSK